MRSTAAALAGLVFACQLLPAAADLLHNDVLSPVHALHPLHRRDDMDEHLRRNAYEVAAEHERRQTTPTTMMFSSAKEEALANWNATTATGCSDLLNALGGRATNPAGMAACYNLPIFDMSTGSFEAEVRMYRITSPIDPWTNIDVKDMTVAITFPNAIRVESSRQTILKRSTVLSWPVVRSEESSLVARQTPQLDPVSIQAYLGQIDPSKMTRGMTRDDLRTLLLPVIVLSSRTMPNITANISTTEAAYVSGALSDSDTVTIPGAITAPAPFVLPGTTLGIFPTGLVITSIWAMAFLSIVGLGTLGRVQFREQYRARMRREMTAGVKTI